MFAILDQIPDAKGAMAYLNVLRSVVDSYLDKKLLQLMRIENIWFAVFFLQCWRQWIILHPSYTLGNNFITQNAYTCVELNAHSLILFLLTTQTLPKDWRTPCIY